MKTGKRCPNLCLMLRLLPSQKKKRTNRFFVTAIICCSKRGDRNVFAEHNRLSLENNNPLYFLILVRKSRAKKEDLNFRLKNLINFG